jgi:hypothetical protein
MKLAFSGLHCYLLLLGGAVVMGGEKSAPIAGRPVTF